MTTPSASVILRLSQPWAEQSLCSHTDTSFRRRRSQRRDFSGKLLHVYEIAAYLGIWGDWTLLIHKNMRMFHVLSLWLQTKEWGVCRDGWILRFAEEVGKARVSWREIAARCGQLYRQRLPRDVEWRHKNVSISAAADIIAAIINECMWLIYFCNLLLL